MLLGPLAAGLIHMAVSRNREFQADTTGAQLSDPLALAAALRKIARGTAARCPRRSGWSQSHLMIANPFRPEGLASLFSATRDGGADRPPGGMARELGQR